MAVQAPAKTKVADPYDYDEDEGPLTFKRNNTTSRQNQLNSEAKKHLSQRPDGQSGRPISGGVSLNGVNSLAQKGKVDQSNKLSAVKSSIASPKALTSASKALPLKSPVTMSKTSTSLEGRSKYSSDQGKGSVGKEEKSSIRQPNKSGNHSEDSEDDMPLSARLKGNLNQASKGVGKPATSSTLPPPTKNVVKESPEDSDDEPLSSRFQMKSNAGTSGSKYNDCDDEKPLSLINKQNGSIHTSAKRPLEKQKSDISSIKKPKISDSSPMAKNKQVLVKAESKEDDDDHVPISQRIKKSPALNSKSPTTKPKITKPVPSSFKKTTKKFKKPEKNSKYSKSTKVSPSSGDGQKKWTTLSHNGVIFPPPYSPHGVKMLYNGKPVDLTPIQEEVALSLSLSSSFPYFC